MGRFQSLRFDFFVFNFDTMKLISFSKVPKSLAPSVFYKKKRNASIVSILTFPFAKE